VTRATRPLNSDERTSDIWSTIAIDAVEPFDRDPPTVVVAEGIG
jgi:hypothetical protein